jgi:patatin-like phospholipase
MMRPARFSLASELWLFATAICLFLAGCASLTQQHRATVLGSDDLRYWADQEDQSDFRRDAEAALAREQKWRQASGQKRPLPTAEFLAISGGGEDGAFGAGLLVGWTAAGTPPQFKGVTGISTGALTAPFAFLGPDYDEKLREVYTKISTDDVLQQRWDACGRLRGRYDRHHTIA